MQDSVKHFKMNIRKMRELISNVNHGDENMDWQQLSKEVEISVRNEIDLMQNIEDESIAEQIDQVIIQKSREQRIPLQVKLKIKNDVFHSLRGYDCLEDIFMLEDVSEIMINGYKNIYVERNGVIEPWMQGFSSEEKYMDVIQQVVELLMKALP